MAPRGTRATIVQPGPVDTDLSRRRSERIGSPRRVVIPAIESPSGRSRPHASEPDVDLSINTTDHLIADIEILRRHLDVETWLIQGTSWGSTLALAYAQRFPHRVSEIVLAAVTMTRRADVEWLCRGVGAFFPVQWERFRDAVPPARRDGDLVAAYAQLLTDPDPEVQRRAARAWCDWEEAILSVETGGRANPRYDDPRFRLGFARLVTHYFSHAAWLGEDQLLHHADRLASTPGVLIHGQLDIGGPLRTAWQLAQAWPAAELVVVGDGGHGSTGIGDQVVLAIDRFVSQ